MGMPIWMQWCWIALCIVLSVRNVHAACKSFWALASPWFLSYTSNFPSDSLNRKLAKNCWTRGSVGGRVMLYHYEANGPNGAYLGGFEKPLWAAGLICICKKVTDVLGGLFAWSKFHVHSPIGQTLLNNVDALNTYFHRCTSYQHYCCTCSYFIQDM